MKCLPVRTVSFAALVAFLTSCYTVPETGRRSLILLPVEQEVALGSSSFTELKSQKRISSDPEMNAAVQRVGPRIAKAVGDALPDAKWEFVVFDDDTPNAFALPGGKVGVHSGLFKIAQTDDELAVVMGHEVAHVTARHGAERISQGLLVAAGGVALDAALKDKDSKERNLWLASYGVAATGFVILPYSRLNESEADNIGIRYAARAGYDPRAAVNFWKRMKEASEGKSKPPEWLSTHPSDDTRIKNLEKLMPEAMKEYEKSLKV
jgi:metalloendopeptidase OMA1, mitochondrial